MYLPKRLLPCWLAAVTLTACAQAGPATTITSPTTGPAVTEVASGATAAAMPSSSPPATHAPEPLAVSATTGSQATAWPVPDWQRSSPEAQGMDSQQLARMLDFIHEQDLNIHSLLVARHGVLVLETYFYPYQANTKHAIYSATKSVSSALVGVAIADGLIPGVDTPMLEFFPDRTVANVDERKRAITLEHLLTMSSGISWRRGASGPPPVRGFELSDDPVQFVLDRPVDDQPGEVFFYNSGGSHLLTAIVQRTTGMTALEYAQQKLFGPLGITDVEWRADPTGVNNGSNGLWMLPRDMARFGLLFLRRGEWTGKQIIPADWVDESTRSHMTPPDQAGYGYQWWINSFGGYYAMGYAGQEIIVVPEQDLVVVITSTTPEQGSTTPQDLTRDFILPAIKSNGALAENRAAAEHLQARATAAGAQPASQPLPSPPDIAARISGKTYRLQSQDGREEVTFTLTFGEERDVAWLELVSAGQQIKAAVGLDGNYRITPTASESIALRGRWKDDKTFTLDHDVIGEAIRELTDFTFQDDQVTAARQSYVGGNPLILQGAQVAP